MRSKPTSRRRAVLIGFLLLSAIGIPFLPKREESPASPENARASAPAVIDEKKPSPARREKSRRADSAPATESEETWDLDVGGQPGSIILALDEAVLRDADGKETLVRLNPPATDATLAFRLAELSAVGGVFPVAYPAGEERSAATRRLVTPDLRVQLDLVTAEQIAARHRLSIKDRPSYAPGWIVMSAADPFAALDTMVSLRGNGEVATADVLLAAQRSLRALPNDSKITEQWHLKRSGTAVAGTDVNIETAWNYGGSGVKGTGIYIGVVDDGLQTAHPDLSDNVDTAIDKDWNGGDADPNPGTGDDHGTACAGNAAARGNNNLGVSGTAPEAKLVGMRLIAASVTDAQEAEAMAYLPDVIEIKTNSWGPSDTGTVLEAPGALTVAALQSAATSGRGGKGSIILWAGGNGGDVGDNSNYDGYANSIHTIAIGATDSRGNRAYYSEPGSNLVVCAPSSGASPALGITTVDRTGSNGYNTSGSPTGDYTDDFGGTSSATPTAAGIVALMLEKNPALGWRDVQEILIRSAFKFKPADAGWTNNAAGFHFNHDFGAGLIDATAAVNLAASWANLPAQTSAVSTQSGLSAAIPDNNTTGITRSFDLGASNIRVEHATVRLSINHSSRGNLEITLVSPSGMTSRLAETHTDSNDNYSNWTLGSVRHWGENSAGIWTVKIADRSTSSNSTGGTLTAIELKLFGSPATPVNPAPLVQITQPAAGQVFSPGALVNVTANASDLTIDGDPGTISQVQFFDNGVSIGTDFSAPYALSFSPAVGSHSLVAIATDSETAEGTSVSVAFSVINQPPVITAATLSASGQSFSDVPLTVQSVTASDPEGTTPTYLYQWESSVNQTLYTNDPSYTTATLPAGPSLAGRLWRCVITASDGNSSSEPFTTAAVNLLARPTLAAATGTPYSYDSGLVLRGTDSPLSRRAIIHEFSQGPSGGSSEWVEILTLQSGSLAYWDLSDAAGNILIFLDDPIWDGIPAGTLIVVYNGASKDPLLPADDSDPADGRMIISSTDPAFFDTESSNSWIPLGNSGDSIFLNDEEAEPVHSIAYGNSTATTPNIGSAGSTKAAYYAGDTDAGADIAANWRVTTGLTARLLKSTRAAGDLFISEYVEGSGDNKALELYNPSGTAVDLATSGYKVEIYFNGSATAGSTFNLTGTLAANATFVLKHNTTTGAISSVPAQFSSFNLNFNGDDAIILKKGTSVVDSFGQVGTDPGSSWTAGAVTTVNKTLRRKNSITQGDTLFTNAFDPSVEWDVFPVDTLDSLGSHGSGPANPALTLNVTSTTFAENTGASAATGSVSVAVAPLAPLVVSLASSDTGEATVPASVTIAAGQTTSPTFAIAAVDDADSDGPQSVELTASAAGYATGSKVLTVTDNEPAVEGVTPGSANNPANQIFVTQLRGGGLNSPALFRFGVGATVPVGLLLDENTGVLSGTISVTNPAGPYLIVIERYNSLGESVSQSFTLTLESSGSYSAWIGNYPEVGDLTDLDDDFDGDGIPNAIENYFGTSPAVSNPGLVEISATPVSVKFRHPLSSDPAADLVPGYEWSTAMETWHGSDAESAGVIVNIAAVPLAPENTTAEVTATVTQGNAAKLFVRLKSTVAP